MKVKLLRKIRKKYWIGHGEKYYFVISKDAKVGHAHELPSFKSFALTVLELLDFSDNKQEKMWMSRAFKKQEKLKRQKEDRAYYESKINKYKISR